jgi:tetratricopeptide (TPR) repeat protein
MVRLCHLRAVITVMCPSLVLAAVLAATLVFAPTMALTQTTAPTQTLAPLGENETYRTCMRQARIAPEKGFEDALQWQDHGGGDAAKHCAAVALINLRQFSEAAKRLESLAQKTPKNTPDDVRAELLAQAGQAWFNAKKPDRAFSVQSAAIKLNAKNADLWVDRAMTLANRGRYKDAISDLTSAIALDANSPDALTLRASAYRLTGNMAAARQDIVDALSITPTHAEGLLESGMLMRLAGDTDGARQDWLKLIELHDGSPAAETAKRNLEKLDVKMR